MREWQVTRVRPHAPTPAAALPVNAVGAHASQQAVSQPWPLSVASGAPTTRLEELRFTHWSKKGSLQNPAGTVCWLRT